MTEVGERDGRYRTEHGLGDDGRYHVRQFVAGQEVVHVSAESRESAVSALRISLLHELVRRGDVRELGKHDECEGCRVVAAFVTR